MSTTHWYVYVLRTPSGTLYTGITTDVPRRIVQHQQGTGKGAKYLRGKAPLDLVFQKKIGTKSLALRVEARIKKMPKAHKEALLTHHADIDLLIAKARKRPGIDRSGGMAKRSVVMLMTERKVARARTVNQWKP